MPFIRRYQLDTTSTRAADLERAVGEFVAALRAIPGFVSGELLRQRDADATYYLDERWTSQAAHAGSHSLLPKPQLKALLALLTAPPCQTDLDVV